MTRARGIRSRRRIAESRPLTDSTDVGAQGERDERIRRAPTFKIGRDPRVQRGTARRRDQQATTAAPSTRSCSAGQRPTVVELRRATVRDSRERRGRAAGPDRPGGRTKDGRELLQRREGCGSAGQAHRHTSGSGRNQPGHLPLSRPPGPAARGDAVPGDRECARRRRSPMPRARGSAGAGAPRATGETWKNWRSGRPQGGDGGEALQHAEPGRELRAAGSLRPPRARHPGRSRCSRRELR